MMSRVARHVVLSASYAGLRLLLLLLPAGLASALKTRGARRRPKKLARGATNFERFLTCQPTGGRATIGAR
jgi:hypothetical protein